MSGAELFGTLTKSVSFADEYYPHYLALQDREPFPLETSKKVIVHLDVNQTLVLEDSVQDKSPADVVQHGLAKACLDIWDSGVVGRGMTYHDFVFNHQVEGPRSNKDLKRQRVALVTKFVPYLENQSPPHPYATEARTTHDTALRLLGAMATSGRKIVPSFYNLVTRLDEAGIEYKIILRSFGNDTEDARDEIEKNTGIQFFKPTLQFLAEKLFPGEGVPDFDSKMAFYQFCQGNHTCVRDDWGWWNGHEEDATFGKIFPLDPEADEVHAIFFDDNLNSSANAKTNIVAPFNASSGEVLGLGPLFDRHVLVPVDPLEPLFDENYFGDCIARSLNIAEGDGV